jgi:peptidoglycan/LPS O-acetylase OafA/YrhL
MLAASPNHKRADITGLRAVAVLAVVIYHAFPQIIGGGFAGVDVFFVISGYLIGGILLKEIDKGEFSFRRFYERRIRRIFPALIIVLAFSLLAGWRFMLPDEYKSLAEQAGAGAASFANVLLWMQTGYFDTNANLKPLLHLWSLGVEEQFYIVWPVLLFLMGRRWRLTLTVTILLIVASFAINVWSLPRFPSATFYLPHTRMWELLAGCLLAHVERFHPDRFDHTPLFSNLKAIAGTALVACAFTLLDSNMLYPGAYALLPVLGTVLLISAGEKVLINRWVLGNPLMVGIGLISYQLYLWHWPLLSFARVYAQQAPSEELCMVLVAAAFILSILTYFVTEPLRNVKIRWAPAVAACAMVIIGSQSFLTYRAAGFPERTARFEKVEKAAGEWEYPTSDMMAVDFGNIPTFSRKGGLPGTVLFIGDSNVEQYWPRVDQILTDSPSESQSVTFMTRGGCPVIPGISEATHPLCTNLTDQVRSYMAAHPEIDTVVIGGYWVAYFENLKTYKIKSGDDELSTAEEPGRTVAIKALGQMIADFRHDGKRVYLILNAPAGQSFDPHSLVARSVFGFSVKEGGMKPAGLVYEKSGVRDRMVAMAKASGAVVIDPAAHLCSQTYCPAWSGDEPIYRDNAHIRATYVRHHATFIDQTVKAPQS